HLALSYDEEVGCLGVRDLIEMLGAAPQRPLLCIVGEPTNMQVATGHKGKLAARAVCKGREGHSALAPLALNAIHLGCDFVRALPPTPLRSRLRPRSTSRSPTPIRASTRRRLPKRSPSSNR